MYASAFLTLDPRVPLRAPAWFDLDDEVQPRRVLRAKVRAHDAASAVFKPFTSWAGASGAPAMQFPILRRNLRRRQSGMAARIEPSLYFDADHPQEN